MTCNLLAQIHSSPSSLHLWYCETVLSGAVVVFLKSVAVNKNIYLELLCDHLEECFELCKSRIFRQEGALCPTNKLFKEYFEFP